MKWFYIFMIITNIIAVIAFGFTHNWYAMIWAFYTIIYLFLYWQSQEEIKRLNDFIHKLQSKENPFDNEEKEGQLIGR